MKKKTLITVGLVFTLCLALAIGFTALSGALFSDTVASAGNHIDAATLQLDVNGSNTVAGSFNLANAKPETQTQKKWTLQNVGTITGYLDVQDIVLTETGGTFAGPEAKAGDTGNAGNLGELVNIRLFWDKDGNGWIGTEDVVFYNGKFGGLPASFDLNYAIPAGGTTYISAIIDWWDQGANDNKGQGDILDLDFVFELGQKTAQ